ncbi:MAG TPA: hypothetical protein ENI06_04720, partial [Spirochaetales bacterium]|nr:hypothetical protein [Spirochaetales bacterium]
GNRFIALFTGFLITGFIQSSSAATVMVVSFVNAGLLNLTQAIGVIMGANIGTTVTGWIVAIIGFKFKITSIALPAVGIGMLLMFAKKLKKEDWVEALVEEMFATFLHVFQNPEMKLAGEVKQVAEQEEITDQMQEQLSQYLVGIFRESLNSRSAAQAGG